MALPLDVPDENTYQITLQVRNITKEDAVNLARGIQALVDLAPQKIPCPSGEMHSRHWDADVTVAHVKALA